MTMWLRAASCPRAHSTWAILLLGGVGIGVYGEGRGWEEGNHDVVSSLTYNKRNNGHWSWLLIPSWVQNLLSPDYNLPFKNLKSFQIRQLNPRCYRALGAQTALQINIYNFLRIKEKNHLSGPPVSQILAHVPEFWNMFLKIEYVPGQKKAAKKEWFINSHVVFWFIIMIVFSSTLSHIAVLSIILHPIYENQNNSAVKTANEEHAILVIKLHSVEDIISWLYRKLIEICFASMYMRSQEGWHKYMSLFFWLEEASQKTHKKCSFKLNCSAYNTRPSFNKVFVFLSTQLLFYNLFCVLSKIKNIIHLIKQNNLKKIGKQMWLAAYHLILFWST